MVRFDSPALAIEVWHDPVSYEIDLNVIDPSGRMHSLRDLGRDDLPADPQRAWMASTRESVAHGVARLSEQLFELSDAALGGDPALLDQAAARREARHRALRVSAANAALRAAAERAWRARDYAGYARLVQSIDGAVTDLERGRLVYARDRIA